eukprot:UN00711
MKNPTLLTQGGLTEDKLHELIENECKKPNFVAQLFDDIDPSQVTEDELDELAFLDSCYNGGEEGEFDMDGEGEVFDFGDFEGEFGDFPFGEGEFGDFEGDDMMGDLSEEDNTDDSDDERSEHDDLHEMLSMEAPAKTTNNKKQQQQKNKASTMGDDSDEDEDLDDDIQAEFNFHDPDNEKDWHATKKFTLSLIDKKDFNASEFADIITQQTLVGTTIKCPDAG